MKKQLSVLTLMSVLVLASCGSLTNNTNQEEVKTLIETYSGHQTAAESASVTGTSLIITEENGEETTYDLPEDEFFVSIAPFKEVTHPCTNHSLTGCQGELTDQSFDISIENTEGEVFYQETKRTGENGFIDLWLPRHDTFFVEITQENKRATAEITTFDDSPTCITTMQLK